LFTVATDQKNTPFGQFELLLNCDAGGCPNGGSGGGFPDPLTFTLLNATAADFAFLSATGPGIGGTPAYFASDVLCTDTLGAGGCNGVTGTIGSTIPGSGGTPSAGQAPEPGSSALAVLGLGIMGLSFAARRKQKKADSAA
jgi:hypothetical protein